MQPVKLAAPCSRRLNVPNRASFHLAIATPKDLISYAEVSAARLEVYHSQAARTVSAAAVSTCCPKRFS